MPLLQIFKRINGLTYIVDIVAKASYIPSSFSKISVPPAGKEDSKPTAFFKDWSAVVLRFRGFPLHIDMVSQLNLIACYKSIWSQQKFKRNNIAYQKKNVCTLGSTSSETIWTKR